MDPVATLRAMREAWEEDDEGLVEELADALFEWGNRGGRRPYPPCSKCDNHCSTQLDFTYANEGVPWMRCLGCDPEPDKREIERPIT